MRVGSLFSGIGGLDLGLEWAGMEIVWQSEIDEYASAVLRKHWPNVPNLGDIRAIDPASLPPVDLVCGGYPCQPFSLAGRRKGQNDDRHLWPVMRKVVEVARPTWVLCENVAGHISMGLDDVLSDLEALGYACQPFIIPAVSCGAQHIRERLFIVANSDRGRELQPERIKRKQRGRVGDGVTTCSADVDRLGRNEGCHQEDGKFFQNIDRISAQTEQTRHELKSWPDRNSGSANYANGFGDDRRSIFTGIPWRDHQPLLGGRVHGVPCRMDRIRCLGNAVVPQVAHEIGRAIMIANNQ